MHTGRAKYSVRLRSIQVVVSLVLFYVNTNSMPADYSKAMDLYYMGKVLNALNQAVRFFAEDYAAMNVDCLFGTQISQGSLLQALDNCSRPDFHCPTYLVKLLKTVTERLQTVSEKALPYIEQEDPAYYALFEGIINKPYIINYISCSLVESIASPGVNFNYNETMGDICLSKMLGTYTEKGRKYSACTVSDDCKDYMLRENTLYYYTTHKLLYLIVAEKTNCISEFETYITAVNASSFTELIKRLCGHIYYEAKKEIAQGNVADQYQDIFLEQNLLCGMYGFEEFFQSNWIAMVLSWQTTNGCFGDFHDFEKELNGSDDLKMEQKNVFHSDSQDIDQRATAYTRRHLMRNKYIKGGCSAHKTGLGTGLLGVYVRYLTNKLYHQTSLQGSTQ